MKKNLYNKNLVFCSLKKKQFESIVVNRAVSFNLLLNNQTRVRAGFLVTNLSSLLKFPVANFRSQCYLTWRTGSFYSFFRLTRLTLRENFSVGHVKGLRKSS